LVIQREVTALVHQDVKVYWITVGVLGSGKRAPVGATPISLSDPGSFADDVVRTIVNELRVSGDGVDSSGSSSVGGMCALGSRL